MTPEILSAAISEYVQELATATQQRIVLKVQLDAANARIAELEGVQTAVPAAE